MSRWMRMFREETIRVRSAPIVAIVTNVSGTKAEGRSPREVAESPNRGIRANDKSDVSDNSSPDAIPHEWRHGVARVHGMPPSDRVPATRWRRLQADAARFLDVWGAKAAALGWSSADLFGVNRVRPFARVDAAGLVRLLDGRPVVAMTDREAVIRCRTGARQAFRPKSASAFRPGERVLLWELAEKDLCLGPEAAG